MIKNGERVEAIVKVICFHVLMQSAMGVHHELIPLLHIDATIHAPYLSLFPVFSTLLLASFLVPSARGYTYYPSDATICHLLTVLTLFSFPSISSRSLSPPLLLK
jgi:hypothetical protein